MANCIDKLLKKTAYFEDYLKIYNTINGNVYDIQISEFVHGNEIEDFIYKIIKNSNYKINGLVFMNEHSDKFYIYTNKEEFNKLKL